METIQGPALFLAQFAGDDAPFNSWDSITKWATDCGCKGVQMPGWDGHIIDLDTATSSQDYCDDFKGKTLVHGVEVTEHSTHLQGQPVAIHPAYDTAFDGFSEPSVHGTPKPRQKGKIKSCPPMIAQVISKIRCTSDTRIPQTSFDPPKADQSVMGANTAPRATSCVGNATSNSSKSCRNHMLEQSPVKRRGPAWVPDVVRTGQI